MATMTSAISLYLAEGGTGLGSSNIVYVSIPDPTATSTSGDQCQGLNLISLPANYAYHCAASSTFRSVNGQGWIPINFSTLPAGSPLGNLPIDPTNQSSSRLYYTYTTNGSQYEVTSVMESSKYQLGGSNDVIANDGGTLASVYEKGSAFGLEPLDYGDASLVGYWSFNEGTGTVAYDYSGSNATGSWSGSQIGSNGYYSTNAKVGPYAGDFDGSTDYVGTGVSNMPIGSGARSVFAWVNPLVTTGGYRSYYYLGGLTGQSGLGIGSVYQSSLVGQLYITTPSIGYVSSFIPPTSTWSFVGYTYTQGATQATIYFDGQSQILTLTAGALTTTASNSFIGYASSFGPYFSGLIDDVRVYNRALTAAQIAAMYAGGK